jgi:hypothetical protein
MKKKHATARESDGEMICRAKRKEEDGLEDGGRDSRDAGRKRTSQLDINDTLLVTCKTGGVAGAPVDLLAVCSVGNPAREPEWVLLLLLADSLVLAKACVSDSVWQLCSAVATRFRVRMEERGGEKRRGTAQEGEGETLSDMDERNGLGLGETTSGRAGG